MDNSTLDIQQKLAALKTTFFEGLTDRLEAILQQWDGVCNRQDHDSVRTMSHFVHNLSGAAGTYGATAVSAAARDLELRLTSLIDNKEALDPPVLESLQLLLDRLLQSTRQWNPGRPQPCASMEITDTALQEKALIYVVDGDAAVADAITVLLEQHDYDVEGFNDLEEFQQVCRDKKPAAIIMDTVFSNSETGGAEAIAQLKRQMHPCPPVIFLSSHRDLESRLAAVRAGAVRYMTKPVDYEALLQTLNGLAVHAPSSPYRVLVVDDDNEMLEFYATVFESAGIGCRVLSDPFQCLEAIETYSPDLIILDVCMPVVSGTDLALVIRQDDSLAHIPILFLSTEGRLDRQLAALRLGADDFLTKPVDADHLLAATVARLKRSRWVNRLNHELKHALRESRHHQVTLDRHAIVSIADAAGRITYVNDKFVEISGYSRDELLGQNHRILKSYRHDLPFYQELWETISSGRVWNGEICNLNKNGTEYWVEATIVPFLDETGRPYQYVSARTDITALRYSEERLQRSQTFANIGTWDWDIDTGELFWSDRIGPLFGYGQEEIETTYENFINAVHPDDRQAVIDAVNGCVERGEAYDIEHRIISQDGKVRWLHERGDVVRSFKENRPLRMLGVVQDITRRKQVESELNSFKTTLDNTHDCVFMFEPGSLKFFYLNRGALDHIGYEEHELLNMTPYSIKPEYDEASFRKLIEPLERGECESINFGTMHRHKNGHDIPVDIVLQYMEPPNEAPRFVAIVRDITERRKAEIEIVRAKEEAENANRAKSQFLSSMSHELRTPLNAIIGFSQLMQMEEDELNETQHDNVGEILKAGHHLLELINEVLDLARIEAGKIDLSLEAVMLDELLDDCVSLVQPLANKRGIDILKRCSCSESGDSNHLDVALRADRTRLKQVLLNLLSNAIKYNYENGKVIIECDMSGQDMVRVSVVDTGPGIASAKQGQLFAAFNRLGADRTDVEGTGIGLVITRNIVELMGGNIGVISEEGKGSTFWVELPKDKIPGHEKASDNAVSNGIDKSLPTQKHVLYIEDNPANLRLVSQILGKKPNLHLMSAHESNLGLDLAFTHDLDLILLDINLPGMDGYEVLEQLRAHEKTKGLPILAISANAMQKDIEKGLQAGFDYYITKPIRIDEFLAAVDQVL